jgi:hypothetical protein
MHECTRTRRQTASCLTYCMQQDAAAGILGLYLHRQLLLYCHTFSAEGQGCLCRPCICCFVGFLHHDGSCLESMLLTNSWCWVIGHCLLEGSSCLCMPGICSLVRTWQKHQQGPCVCICNLNWVQQLYLRSIRYALRLTDGLTVTAARQLPVLHTP